VLSGVLAALVLVLVLVLVDEVLLLLVHAAVTRATAARAKTIP